MKKLFLFPICAALAAVGAGSLMSAKSYTESQAIQYLSDNYTIATGAGDLIPGDDKAAALVGDNATVLEQSNIISGNNGNFITVTNDIGTPVINLKQEIKTNSIIYNRSIFFKSLR